MIRRMASGTAFSARLKGHNVLNDRVCCTCLLRVLLYGVNLVQRINCKGVHKSLLCLRKQQLNTLFDHSQEGSSMLRSQTFINVQPLPYARAPMLSVGSIMRALTEARRACRPARAFMWLALVHAASAVARHDYSSLQEKRHTHILPKRREAGILRTNDRMFQVAMKVSTWAQCE